jgi:NTE family protein
MHIERILQNQASKTNARFRVSLSILGLVLVLLCLAAQAFGQTEQRQSRPRIGLALASGGALGLAHIGVLDWFDKHHIPIDYIAGTSMGGLMGGGFAIGMTPDELRTTLKDIDWNQVFSNGPTYHQLPLRRKQDLRAVPSSLVVGLHQGIEMPGGISAASPIDLLLSRLCLPYSELKSFNELPTPFRCVAVDVQSGQAVTFKDGSLVTALRATMAIPAFFTPVERDGTLYIDGGTLNSIPTEAVKAMGADIIIAVDLASFFLSEPKPKTFVDVLSKSIDVSIYANERRSLTLADIVLTPDLRGLDSADFTRVDTFATRGYQAAEARKNILAKLALGDVEWQAYLAQRNARKRATIPTPAFVAVTGVSARQAQALAQQLRRFVDVPLNTLDLDRELTAITGLGRYDSFFYGATRRGNQTGLLIQPNPGPIGPSLLRFGLQINGADTNNVLTDLAARLTVLDAGSPGAEIRTDLRAGSDRDLAVEYYRPVANGGPFLAPQIFLRNDSFGLYSGGVRLANYSTLRVGTGLDIGINTSRDSELRFGYQFEHEEAAVRTGSRGLPSLYGDAGSLRLGWLYDGQDSPTIPSRGVRVAAESRWYFYAPDAPRSFPLAAVNLSGFHPVGKGDSVYSVLGAGTTFGNTVGLLEQFTVGGPASLAAYGPGEFRGNAALHLTLGYLHHVGELPAILGGKVMLAGAYQVGGAFERFGTGRYLNDVSVGLVADTLIGPVSVGYGYGEAGRNQIYFAIGGLFP